MSYDHHPNLHSRTYPDNQGYRHHLYDDTSRWRQRQRVDRTYDHNGNDTRHQLHSPFFQDLRRHLHLYDRMVLTALGDQSVYMWFFHALFFVPPVRTVFQPLIRISDNIFVVTMWSIALTFCISWALHKIVDLAGGAFSRH